MVELLIGTNNKGKLKEYKILLKDAPVTLLSLGEVGLGDMDVEETGTTFLENAELKAIAYAKASGKFTLADDSGLCVDALDGGPGVYSARYAGPNADDAARRQKLLGELLDLEQQRRTARFECVIAVADPNSLKCMVAHGIVPGKIATEEHDEGRGFGYDALFIPDGYDETFAQLDDETKNRLSHRGRAAQQIVPLLRQIAREQNQ